MLNGRGRPGGYTETARQVPQPAVNSTRLTAAAQTGSHDVLDVLRYGSKKDLVAQVVEVEND
jgi:hypothetical protein